MTRSLLDAGNNKAGEGGRHARKRRATRGSGADSSGSHSSRCRHRRRLLPCQRIAPRPRFHGGTGASNGCVERSTAMSHRSPSLSRAHRASSARPNPSRCGVAATFVLAALAATSAARGDVLFQRQFPLTFQYDVQPSRPINGPIEFTWALFEADKSVSPPLYNQPGRVFDALRFTPATVGQTFRLLPGDDPDFATFEANLTNGREDNLWE